MLNPQALQAFIEEEWQEDILPSLCEYIKIPNKSPTFDPKWVEHGYMEQAVLHITQWCQAHALPGMQLEIVRLEGRTPLLYIEIPGHTDDTVLLYGHLDKQPEMSGWEEDLDPWMPVMRDGKLYGRGGADDGYAIYASLTALRALQSQGLTHGRCVVLIEASEESGSNDLPYYIEILKERIGEPSLVVCLDSGAGNYEQLWVTTSLRGNLVGELSVELLQEGVHSGDASGIVADSFRVMRELLERVEDGATGEIKLRELYCEIPEERMIEAAQNAVILGQEIYRSFPFHPGVLPVDSDLQQLVLNRTWRPQLTIIGADGLPSIPDAGNVMRPKTVLKLSMRLPPTVCPEAAGEALNKALTERSPYDARVTLTLRDGAKGWAAPSMAPWLTKAVHDASMMFYQNPVVYRGEGGTIPFMGMLGKQFPNAQFVITGVLGPHSNAHGPNEFLHLDMVKKLTACVSYIIHQHGL